MKTIVNNEISTVIISYYAYDKEKFYKKFLNKTVMNSLKSWI